MKTVTLILVAIGLILGYTVMRQITPTPAASALIVFVLMSVAVYLYLRTGRDQ
jgi:CHASE2 domain-containing sensor protein